MLPYFYHASAGAAGDELTLDEDNSRHIAQVLRMKPGEALQLTNGKGALVRATIIDNQKKKCRVRVESVTGQPPRERQVAIAISPVKNASRFEWFLEKATEIGVSAIIPLLCERTERQHHRPDRWQNILVSAMLQSQQSWLPALASPAPFVQVIAGEQLPASGADREGLHASGVDREELPASGADREGLHASGADREGLPASGADGGEMTRGVKAEQRLIAHCLEAPRPTGELADLVRTQRSAFSLILIGPEGDFSASEVELALGSGFVPVTLGNNRLRTETAGIVAATLLCI